jgi:outer membrane protein OmpA-like peptidoglycan-associated protein
VTDTKLPNGSRLQLYDVSDKLIIDVTSRENRGFSFMLLTPEDYFIEKIANDDTSILSVDIFGKVADDDSKELGGLKIVLLDSLGDVIGNTFTNADGNFVFESVRPNDSYVIITEVLNVNSVIHIVDNEGTVINSIKPNESNEYVYVRLTSSDKVITLTNELQQRVRISDKDQFDIGHIYFGLNEFEIDDNGAQSLVRLITILKGNQHVFVDMSGHTDSKGADEYNLKLSQFRIDAVIRFLVSGGIDESRLDGTGYGERKILNHCKDGLECSEEEHAKNRRTEFRLFEKD